MCQDALEYEVWTGSKGDLQAMMKKLTEMKWDVNQCHLLLTGTCDGFCDHGGTCMQSNDGSRQCRCPPRFIGNNCDVDKCHYCRDGKCIPTNIYQPHGDVTCRYTISCSSTHIQMLGLHRIKVDLFTFLISILFQLARSTSCYGKWLLCGQSWSPI